MRDIGEAILTICVYAVCPGIIDTSMLYRFTGGTPEGRERMIAQESVGRMGNSDEAALSEAYAW